MPGQQLRWAALLPCCQLLGLLCTCVHRVNAVFCWSCPILLPELRPHACVHSLPPPSHPSEQADLQAAELAKRSLAAEREELAAVREELRRQQAAAAAEAGRLAELQKVSLGVQGGCGRNCRLLICSAAT